METKRKWYPKKRPNLQIDILECLAINGNLTKGMAEKILEKRHESILDSFNILENINFIKKNKERGAFEPGRRHNFYQITDLGLEALIDEYSGDSLKFWNILTDYCFHHDKFLGYEKTSKFVNLFKEKVSKYAYPGYTFQLNTFDQTLEMCIQSFINKADGMSNGQKLLEILSEKRGLTFRQLVDEMNLSNSDISELLSLYTLEDYEPLKDNRVFIFPNMSIPIPSEVSIDIPFYVEENLKKKYADFFLHCLIISSKCDEGNDDEKKYELSLYGLMVVIAIIRYHDMGKMRHNLFYKDMVFPDYFNKIAKNYQDKLPLIFGKWDILKKVLKLFAEYNFDIIVNKDFRQRAFNSRSIVEGGNKELLYGIEQIALQNRNGLSNFVLAGEISLRNYIDKWYESNGNISTLRNILNELNITIHPLEYAFNEFSAVQYNFDKDISRRYLIEKIVPKYEKMLEWEISSMYYFNLFSDNEFKKKLNHPMTYFSLLQNKKELFPLNIKPIDCLHYMFEIGDHGHIRAWFYEIMDDLHLYIKIMERNIGCFLVK
jgi:hypothetical protein